MHVPAGIPNEAELLHPVGAIPHSGDIVDEMVGGACCYWIPSCVYMQNMQSIFIALNYAECIGVCALVLPELYSSSVCE